MAFACSGAFDIETIDWDRFALASTFDGTSAKIWRSPDALIDYMRGRGGIWWSHAGGVFDLLLILERLRERGISCSVDRSQHRITRIVCGNLTLRDSYSLWPVPLDDLAGAIGESTPALPWTCICDRDCAGFCQLGQRALEGDPDLDAYCIADSRILYRALHALADFAIEHKIILRGTLGQTAWASAQAEIGVPDSEIPWKIWDHVRRGDKGGRAAIIRPLTRGPGAHYDLCNAYPAQLAHTELPVGRPRELGGKKALYALGRETPGIYTLTVRVPEETFLPSLPWHCGGALTFPVGEFSGSWPLPEIGAALDRGVEIVEAHAAIVYPSTGAIFAPLVERWYAIRKAIGRKTPFGQWIGRLAKAFTGKLAEKPDRSRVAMHPSEIKVCDRKGSCRNGCTGRCGAYEQLDFLGEIWSIPYKKLGPSAYPEWSAYLRAQTRVQWLEQAERMGPNGRDLVFGNTDSIWATGRSIPRPTGSQLGQWEFQGTWTDLEIRSVGSYAFRDKPNGELIIRGIPGLTEADWKRGHGIIDRGVMTFGRAVKGERGLFRKRSRRWSLPTHEREVFGDRRLGASGVTYPMHAQELRERLAAARASRSRR